MSEWTNDEVREYIKNGTEPRRGLVRSKPMLADPQTTTRHRQASPRGTMNKTEARYAFELDLLLRAGEIQWYAFEPVTLRLAKRTSYTPDFLVQHKDGSLEFIETKGFWEDDARVKIKVAAKMFPMFKFSALQPTKGGGWKREEFTDRRAAV